MLGLEPQLGREGPTLDAAARTASLPAPPSDRPPVLELVLAFP